MKETEKYENEFEKKEGTLEDNKKKIIIKKPEPENIIKVSFLN